jgi:hypothetical protein
MLLNHVCPNCKKTHEMAVTPEPDHLCSECQERLMYKNSARLTIDFDCGNCSMTKAEADEIEDHIKVLVKEMNIDITKVEWHGLG